MWFSLWGEWKGNESRQRSASQENYGRGEGKIFPGRPLVVLIVLWKSAYILADEQNWIAFVFSWRAGVHLSAPLATAGLKFFSRSTKAPPEAVQFSILSYVFVGETHLTNHLFAFKQLQL